MASVGHFSRRAMTEAMVWLPLPGREMPRVVPLRSSILWYGASLPVMTALERELQSDAFTWIMSIPDQLSGVVT